MSEPEVNRRRFFGLAAATVAAGPLGLLKFSGRVEAMTDVMTGVAQRTGSDTAEIRPFHVHFPDAELTELRRRIKATRWPERENVRDASQGVQLATTQALAEY